MERGSDFSQAFQAMKQSVVWSVGNDHRPCDDSKSL